MNTRGNVFFMLPQSRSLFRLPHRMFINSVWNLSLELLLRHKVKSAVKSLSTAADLHYSRLSAECVLCLFSTQPLQCCLSANAYCLIIAMCASVCPVCLCGAPGNFNQALCTGAPECVRPSMSARRICPFTTGGLCVEYKSEALHYLESGRGETPSGGQDTIKLAGQLWPCVISRAAACVLYSGAANLLWWCYMFSPAIVMTHRLEAEDTDLKITWFLWRTRNAATLDDIYALIFL